MDSRCSVLTLCFLGAVVTLVSGSNMMKLTDDEVAHAAEEHPYMLTFLIPGACDSPECMYASSELSRVIEAGTIPGLIVFQIPNSNFAKKLSNNPEPRVVFYRNSVPILYDDGLILRDEILTWMENNKVRHSTILNSDNFEHLTQAATGATTGDWMVLFHKKGCDDLMPTWEAVAGRLKHKLNVAEVDIASSSGLKTRFQLERCPAVLFFRHGKMYSYELTVRDPQSFVSFADGWYTNAPSKPVPIEPSPFDVFTDKIASSLKDTSELTGTFFSFWGIVSMGVILIAILVCVKIVRNRRRKQKLF